MGPDACGQTCKIVASPIRGRLAGRPSINSRQYSLPLACKLIVSTSEVLTEGCVHGFLLQTNGSVGHFVNILCKQTHLPLSIKKTGAQLDDCLWRSCTKVVTTTTDNSHVVLDWVHNLTFNNEDITLVVPFMDGDLNSIVSLQCNSDCISLI